MARKQGKPLYWVLTAVTIPFRFWIVGRNEKVTLGDFLDKLFGDDEAVKVALCANLCYFSDDPYKLSLLFFSVAQGSYLGGGCHYIRGGSSKLSEYLVGIIEGAGGSALHSRSVNSILLEDGRAVGVTHTDADTGEDSRNVRSPVIFGNASPLVLGKMLPEEGRQYEHVPRPSPSGSHTSSSIAPPRAFACPATPPSVYPQEGSLLRDTRNHAAIFGKPPAEKMPVYVIVDYGRIDSGICGDSKYVVAICGLDRISNWKDLPRKRVRCQETAWQDAIIDDADNTTRASRNLSFIARWPPPRQ